MARLRKAAVPAGCAVIAVAMLAPVLWPGFVLVYDMVFTPRQPLRPESIGLGPGLPRAVPADAVVALLTTVIPGAVLQKAILLGTVFLAALGAARLVPSENAAVRLTAGVVYGWNAYVAERLFLGHWTLLVGYASLPWVFAAALRFRADGKEWMGVVLACAPAALAPSGGLLATGAALAAAGWRRALPVVAINLGLNAPWWVPGLLRPGRALSDPAAVEAFSARGEGWGGPVAAVLSLGGIWNADVVPASRRGALVAIAALLLLAAAIYGAIELSRRFPPGAGRSLYRLAALGIVLSLAAALPGTGGLLRWAVEHVPGAGLLRDGQKWTAWWAMLAALGWALAAETLSRGVSGLRGRPGLSDGVRAPILAGALLLPIALLPDLAWGGLGRLDPVRYPADWAAVSSRLEPGHGDVLVLPFQAYRRFSWNDNRPQLDPAPRYLPSGAVIDDTLRVSRTRIRGEDSRAARLRTALAAHEPLAPLGIGWVLVEHGTPGDVDPALLTGLSTVYSGRWVTLYRVPEPTADQPRNGPPALPVIAADVVALGALAVAGFVMLRRRLLVGTFR
jgi:hypothetical protein